MLSTASFSAEQRDEIINALIARLQFIIKTPEALKMILAVTYLTHEQRTFIKSSMPKTLLAQINEEAHKTRPEGSQSFFSFFQSMSSEKNDNPFFIPPPNSPFK